jgi:hypothetical protein
MDDEKDLIYRVARAYVEAEEPDELEELEEDFELIFRKLQAVASARDPQRSERSGSGLSFDAAFVDMTVTASVTWIATHLVHALVHGLQQREVRERLATIEAQLVEQTRQAERVRKLAAVVEIIWRAAVVRRV